jgi:manganese/zinc/iron transport system substrate-binding protein
VKAIYNCFIILLVLFAACSSPSTLQRQQKWQNWKSSNGKLKVLATTSIIADVVQQIGGEHVNVLTLIGEGLDPHSYQLVKGDDEKLAFADLIFYNGLGLEHGPSIHNFLESDAKALALGNILIRIDPTALLFHSGQVDPHVWMDISLWSQTIPYIADFLSLKDPAHSAEYLKNASALQGQYLKAHADVVNLMRQIPDENRFLVTSHDAFSYFAKAYLAGDNEKERHEWNKRFISPEGLSPESQLSLADIRLIIDHLIRYHIEVIFSESNVSKDSVNKIVNAGREKGLKIEIPSVTLYADAMGYKGSNADTYLKMIQHNAQAISKYLQPKSSHDK